VLIKRVFADDGYIGGKNWVPPYMIDSSPYTTTPYINPQMRADIDAVANTFLEDKDRKAVVMHLEAEVFDLHPKTLKVYHTGTYKQLYSKIRITGPKLMGKLRKRLEPGWKAKTREFRGYRALAQAAQKRQLEAFGVVQRLADEVGTNISYLTSRDRPRRGVSLPIEIDESILQTDHPEA